MFIIKVPYLSLDRTYESGQNLRWVKLNHEKYIIYHHDKAVKAEMKNENLYLSCTEDEFFDVWYKYFSIDVDYEALHLAISKGKELLNGIVEFSKGVRIIRKDPIESIISYILKRKYKTSYYHKSESFIRAYGTERKVTAAGLRIIWPQCPTIKQLSGLTEDPRVNIDRKAMDYITQIANDILEDWYTLDEIVESAGELRKLGFEYLSDNLAKQLALHSYHVMNVIDLTLPDEEYILKWLDETGFEMSLDEYKWLLESYRLADVASLVNFYIMSYMRSKRKVIYQWVY